MNIQQTLFPAWVYRQSAALPYRWRGGTLEVLLITTRRGRWIVPKGIVEPGLSSQSSAAKEALEEGGVRGDVAEAALGSYRRRKWGGTCDVTVYPLLVSREFEDWADSGFRRRRWLSVPDALGQVEQEGLRTVIARLPEVAPEPGTFVGRLRPPQQQARLVYLLHHAEQGPDANPAEDFNRSATSDHITGCKRVQRYLSMADVRPDLVLCSSVPRARQTLAAIMPAIGATAVVSHLGDVGQEDPDALIRRLRRTEPELGRVMLVGEDPAMLSLATRLVDRRLRAGPSPRDDHFRTAALAILVFRRDSWKELDEGSCELHSLVAASDLRPST